MASRAYDCTARRLRRLWRRAAGFSLTIGLALVIAGPASGQVRPPVSPAIRLATPASAGPASREAAARIDMPADAGSVDQQVLTSAEGDENWQQLFGANQAATNGDIFAIASVGSEIYIAGSFTSIGGIAANHIARWDGKAWNRLGDSAVNGLDANAYALVVSGDTIYVGGEFTRAGGVNASRVARFVKSSGQWSALGEGVTGPSTVYVGALAVARGSLYVGGNFTRAGAVDAASIAKVDPKTGAWSDLGGVDGEVYAMTSDANNLYFGGNFSRAGSVAAGNVAAVNLQTGAMSALGQGVNGYVNALAFWKGQVVAGGEFSVGGAVNANLAQYAGGGWLALSAAVGGPSDDAQPGTPDGVVRALAADGSMLYVGGIFHSAAPGSMTSGAVPANNIVRWNGSFGNTAFESMASGGYNGTTGPVNAILLLSRNVYVTGAFRTAGKIGANRIAVWDGRKWASMGEERFETGNVYALLVNGNDVYIGRPVNAYGQGSIAKWNGKGWTTIGLTAGSVYALAISGDELFVGGRFSSVEGVSAVNIARFNLKTNTWSSFGEGSGVGGGTYSVVQAIKVRGDDLYIGGRFLIADTIEANNIAVYNRTANTWRSLGASPTGINFNIVYALEFGPQGELYVGGRFTEAGGGEAMNIAKYANGAWSALGAGVDGAVYAMTITEGKLYAGGDFKNAGGQGALRIASYDLTSGQWAPLGGGLSGGPLPVVFGLASNGPNVYVAGLFRMASGDSVNRIVRWNTASNSWKKLGSGVDNTVRAVVLANNMLHVVGEFGVAGIYASPNYAQWSVAKDGSTRRAGEEGRIELAQNYPNPFNPTTMIRFTLDRAGYTTLRVFDISGNEVRRLVESDLAAGEHAVVFDGTDLGSGMYFYQLANGERVETRKLLLSK